MALRSDSSDACLLWCCRRQADLQGVKRETAASKQATEQLYEARDSAQLSMAEIKLELDQTRQDIQQEFDRLSLVVQEAAMTGGSESPGGGGDGFTQFSRSGGDGFGGSGPKTAKGQRKPGTVQRKRTKAEKLQALQEEWDKIVALTGMSDDSALVEFFEDAEKQVGTVQCRRRDRGRCDRVECASPTG